MNCANHPDVAVAAYCQSCGKPMCAQCMRSVGGVVYCEPCLAARVYPPPSSLAGPGVNALHAHPLLAGLLGFIPGVGAMYNGQFVKALAHVLIFAVFVSLADKSFIFGLLIAAWVFYQVFDAAQTAKARRDGLPLPNPFGLYDLGVRLGMATAPYAAGFAAPPPAGAQTPYPQAPFGAAPGPDWSPNPPGPNPGPFSGANPGPFAGSPTPPAGAVPGTGAEWSAVPPPTSYYTAPPGPGMPLLPIEPQQKHPVGAVILIVIGAMLLLHTLGIFEDEWLSRAWPLILIGIGGWLLYRRTLESRGGSR